MVKGLGRGLSALFSDTEEAYGFGREDGNATEVPISAVHPNPDQPRNLAKSVTVE